ncbi:unnamed protein product, partial [Heterotrigona itama]
VIFLTQNCHASLSLYTELAGRTLALLASSKIIKTGGFCDE